MTPYRHPPEPDRPTAATGGEDLLICAVVAACGLLRVAIAIATGEVFRVEATVALILLALGVTGLVVAWRGRGG